MYKKYEMMHKIIISLHKYNYDMLIQVTYLSYLGYLCKLKGFCKSKHDKYNCMYFVQSNEYCIKIRTYTWYIPMVYTIILKNTRTINLYNNIMHTNKSLLYTVIMLL